MDPVQAKLLSRLAKKIASAPNAHDHVMATLVAAKILTKSGNFTSNYPNLKKLTYSKRSK